MARDKWQDESEAKSHFKIRNRQAFIPLLSNETFADEKAKSSLIADLDRVKFDEALRNELHNRIVLLFFPSEISSHFQE